MILEFFFSMNKKENKTIRNYSTILPICKNGMCIEKSTDILRKNDKEKQLKELNCSIWKATEH